MQELEGKLGDQGRQLAEREFEIGRLRSDIEAAAKVEGELREELEQAGSRSSGAADKLRADIGQLEAQLAASRFPEPEGFCCVAKTDSQNRAGGMNKSDEYRRFAAECVKIAHAAEDGQRQAVFLKMAEVRLDLARKAEIKSERQATDTKNDVN